MTDLYRHFDARGNLLYVGISLSAMHRLAQHYKSPWFQRIAVVKVARYKTRQAAAHAEKRAILKEKPQFNKTFLPATPPLIVLSVAEVDQIKASLAIPIEPPPVIGQKNQHAVVLGRLGGLNGSRADKIRAGRLGGLAKGRKGKTRKEQNAND